MGLIPIALAPVFIILLYVYFRDKYEKEPFSLLMKSLFAGAFIVLPVIYVETFLGGFYTGTNQVSNAAYTAFVVAGFTEEIFKFAALYLLIWKNPEFNEKFDGIVYAVFISLGFAGIENIMYVLKGGIDVGLTRSITAVPAHALFGITMGYYFGLAHMYSELRKKYLRMALIVPIVFHGIYDFILMSQIPMLLLGFIPFLVFLYIYGFKRMKVISDSSIFRPVNLKDEEGLDL
jgi:RsiW-degrading membrane proteinase PrsW (M82 family)